MSWDLYGIPGRGGMTCPSILQVPKWRCDLECATELYRRVPKSPSPLLQKGPFRWMTCPFICPLYHDVQTNDLSLNCSVRISGKLPRSLEATTAGGVPSNPDDLRQKFCYPGGVEEKG